MCEMNPLDDVRDAILAPSSREAEPNRTWE